MVDNLTFTEVLVVEVCCRCGIPFGLTNSRKRELLESRAIFYCTNGHGQSYTGENTQEKLNRERQERERLQRELKATQDSKEFWRNSSENNGIALQKARVKITKMKKRSQAGMCQCCKRTFQNVQRHYATKHPEYAKEQPK